MAFSSIRGQDKALSLLSRALTSGRLAHAYFFAGPDGVGKRSLALDMAALLCCGHPQGQQACGLCSGCQMFASNNHPDLLHIRPQGAAIKINQIRELKQALQFPPLQGGLRIVILEEAQTMRREAANSLLKLLEEPPPGNLLLLLGSNAGGILPTILSRCQIIPFVALSLPLAAEIIGKQRPEFAPDQALLLAALADGCPGQALAMKAQEVLSLHQRLIAALLSPPATAALRTESALALATELPVDEEGMAGFLHLLRLFCKQALMASLEDEQSLPNLSPEARKARERWNMQEISAKVVAIDLMEQALARNCNRALCGEVLMLSLFDCIPSVP